MTDEEVERWLEVVEAEHFRADSKVDAICGMVQRDSRAPILRKVAALRKALRKCEGYAYDRISENCIFCGRYRHDDSCPFAPLMSMPRPR